jgi:hypothetical protein
MCLMNQALEAQEIDMDVFALLFTSTHGVAALGSVTLAVGMLVSTFVVLAQKAARAPSAGGLHPKQSGH